MPYEEDLEGNVSYKYNKCFASVSTGHDQVDNIGTTVTGSDTFLEAFEDVAFS